MRVHELAKTLGLASKDLLAKLKEKKIEAKSHMTVLDEDVVKLFLEERAAKGGKIVVFKKAPESEAKASRKSSAKEHAPEAAKPAPVLSETPLVPSPAALRPSGAASETGAASAVAAPPQGLKPLEVAVPVIIKDLAIHLKVTSSELIKLLITQFKTFANINQSLSEETVREVVKVYGFELKVLEDEDEMAPRLAQKKVDPSRLRSRSPIVTFMGHVDHGKTSLLDAIRRTKVAESEHGGITQHIGAYEVKQAKGSITFLDTPGHEAFTAMRARGANVTDIVVLVIAADDGVMPQTIEALDHARAAKVPIIVAMNKIDKPQANVDKLKRQLNELGLVAEDWGGKTICAGVSAKTGEGIDHLLEMILLEAEMLELKTVVDQEAVGIVIEAKLSKGRGPVATVLVQSGTLRVGDFVIAGYQSGRVKAMANSFRQPIEEAGPSKPVEITGLSGVPEAGERFNVVNDAAKARVLVDQRQEEQRRRHLEPASKKAHIHLEDLYKGIKEGHVRDLNIILKADVQGSLEAIEDSLKKLENPDVNIIVMHKGVGPINSSDVVLAVASNAIIIGFHVEPDDLARVMASKDDIDIRTYRVIYEIFNDMKAALEGMLAPKLKKNFIGRAEVKKVFNVTKGGIIAGSAVKKGKMLRGAAITLVRNGQVIHEGKIAVLKRFKDDVREVAEGFECGISIANFQDVREGDVIDAFEMEQVARKLNLTA